MAVDPYKDDGPPHPAGLGQAFATFCLVIRAVLSSEDRGPRCSTLRVLSGPFDLCVWGRGKETNIY